MENMTLNDIYHISMIIVGFGSLFLGFTFLFRFMKKDKQRKIYKKFNRKGR